MMKRWYPALEQGLRIGMGVGLCLIALWLLRLFVPLQLSLMNFYYAPQTVSNTIILVQLDDASLQVYGRSPASWQRSIYADLIERLDGARVVTFDLLFSEAAEDDELFAQAMQEARASEARTRFVLAGAGVGTPIINGGEDDLPRLRYGASLHPVAPLATVADYIAYVNAFPDADGLVRRQPLLIESPTDLHWSLSAASYLAYLRVPASVAGQVVRYEAPFAYLSERTVFVDDAGVWLQDYFGAPTHTGNITFDAVSLLDVLEGRIDAGRFNDKIVIIGLMNSVGSLDQYPVPSAWAGELMAGMEIQANALESLLQNRTLMPIPDMWYGGLILVLAVVTALLYVRPLWYIKLGMMTLALMAVPIMGTFLFNQQGMMMGLLHPLLAVSLPALLMIGQDITREIRRRQRADFLLDSVVAVSEQRLSIARILRLLVADIQRIAPRSVGSIWLVPMASGQHLSIKQAETWGDVGSNAVTLSPLDLLTLQKPVHIGTMGYYPMRSQGRLLGVVALYGALTERQESLLMDLTQRIAPTLEAGQLYALTEHQRALLQTVLAQSPSAVVALNVNGGIALRNEQFTRLASNDHERFMAWLSSVIEDGTIIGRIQQAFEQGVAFQQPVTIADKHYIMQTVPLETDLRWVLLLNEVTDLVELNRLKTRMIRMASHDLKNPLARVNGYVQLIDMNDSLDEEDRQFLQRIMEASEEMNSLITDILNLERLHSSEVMFERLDMKALVQQIYWRHEPEAQIKRQTYAINLPDAPLYIDGDLNQLSQTISNLVNNAIKYTPEEGHIQMNLFEAIGEDVTPKLRFEVKDTGYGIPMASQEKLFTEFYRVRTSQTAGISGTGLGLSLVKSVIDAHHGKVGFTSQEGEGSLFYVELSLHADQSSPLVADSNFWDGQL